MFCFNCARVSWRFPASACCRRLLGLLFFIGFSTLALAGDPQLQLPQRGIDSSRLAVVINRNDPLSVAVGELYAKERAIPSERIVYLRFPADSTALGADDFKPLKEQMDKQLPDEVQGLLLTWLKPYRVACMSITSAFTLGFHQKYCAVKAAGKPCGPTAASPYFDSSSDQPWSDLQVRPSMMLGAVSLAEAKALIARGIASERSKGQGSAYLLSTSDRARNVRAVAYESTKQTLQRWLNIQTPVADSLRNKKDVLFYFTGLAQVEAIGSNTFLPGAVADHLTSFGGMLTDSTQMSALAWIKAGATGSYGTVMEPCAYRQKFPDPPLMMLHYLAGERLLEAYWKSVAWPAEGIFVGDPLARPFPGYFVRKRGRSLLFDIPWLKPGPYLLESAPALFGPFTPVARIKSLGQPLLITIPAPVNPYYRLRSADAAPF